MKQIRLLFDFYLKSSIHVALAVAAFTGITMLNFDRPLDSDLLVFIFFGTVTGYNFVKYAAIAKFRHFSLPGSLRAIQVFSFLCFSGLIWYALKLPKPVLLAAGALVVINLLYALPVFNNQNNLRSITGIKIFVIAFVWSGVTVGLPVLDAGMASTPEILMAFLQRFLFVLVLTLPFDIRDLRFDTEQLGTIPQLFGVENTRNIGLGLLALVVIMEFLQSSAGPKDIAVLAIIAVLTAFLIRKSVVRQTQYYASFWVEGIPILWFVMLTLL